MANLSLGVVIQVVKDQLSAWADQAKARLANIGPSATKAAGDATAATTKAAASVKALGTEADKAGRQFEEWGPALGRISALLGAGFTAKGIAEVADEMANLAARLNVATGSAQGGAKALQDIRNTANETGATLGAVGELYARLARSTKDLGASQAEVAEVTNVITKALAASGEAGAGAEAAIIQLGQAFASGTLRGDELRSVLEQVPRLARAIADGLGVPIGKLRELGEAGALTSEQVFRAVQSQREVIEREFAQLPDTIGRAVNRVSNEWKIFIAELDRTTGASQAAASALNAVSANLERVISLAETAGIVIGVTLVAKAIPAIKAFGAELMAATATTGGLTAAIAKVPGSIKIAVAIAGAEIAVNTVEGLARSLAAYVEGSAEAEAASERSRDRWRELAVEANKTAVAFDEFANVRVKTSEEVAKLTDQERDAYREALAGAQQYQLAIYQNALAWEGLGKNTTTAQEKAQKAVQALKAGMVDLERGTALAANAAKSLLSLDALKLVNQFDDLRKQGKTLAEALREVSSAFDAGSLTKVQAYGQALGELADRGILTARDLREEWESALAPLSAERLVEFQTVALAAFGDTRQEVASLTAATDVLSRRALAELGVDADRALSGMSSKAREAVASVDLLIRSTTQLKAEGVEVGKVLAEALTAAIGAADTQQAVDALRSRIEELGKAGTVATKDIETLTAALTEQAAKITPGIQTAKEAYDALGITSQAALQKTADGARDAYEALVRLGVPLADQRAAFLAYTEAAIAANGGVASAVLKAKAATLGLSGELSRLSGSTTQAAAALEDLRGIQERGVRAAERNTDAVREHGTAMVAAAQQAMENAKVQGDALGIAEATVAVREAEAKAAQELAVALANEAANAWNNVAAMKAKAAADGEVTAAEKQAIDTARERARELGNQAAQAAAAAKTAKASADQAAQGGAVAQSVAVDWGGLATQYGLAASRADELAEMQGRLWARMVAFKEGSGRGFRDFDDYVDSINQALEGAANYIKAMDRVETTAKLGTEGLDEYIRAIKSAMFSSRLLGQEEMEPLREALRDAQDQMRDLSQSARDTLNSLRDELDEMNKNYDAIEKRRYESRKAELEAQLVTAKAAGNASAVADLSSALRLLKEVSSKNIAEAKAREREEARKLKSGAAEGDASSTSPAVQVTKVVDINLRVGKETATVQAVEGSEEALVAALRASQMVAS
jgi:tape measure domain-containing protein